jgi:hypothetical protein
MKPRKEFKFIIGLGIVFATLTALILQTAIFAPGRTFQSLMILKIFFTSFNIIIFSGLLVNYVKLHRQMPTPLTKTLSVFSFALLLYGLTSSPLVHILFGFNILTIGPFTFLPDMFASMAAVAILYESYR